MSLRPVLRSVVLDPVRAELAHLLARWLVAEVRKDAESQAGAIPSVESPSGHDRGRSPARRRDVKPHPEAARKDA